MPTVTTNTDLAAAIVASVSALYGFTIAYYAFARTLSRQEERWVWEDFRAKPQWIREDELRSGQRGIAFRRVALNILLIATTVLFAPSVMGGLFYLATPTPGALALAVGGFAALVAAVLAYFLLVGVMNIRDTLRDMQPPPRGGSKTPEDTTGPRAG